MSTFAIGAGLTLRIENRTFVFLRKAEELAYFEDVLTGHIIPLETSELLKKVISGDIQVMHSIATFSSLLSISTPPTAVDFSRESKWVNRTYARHEAYTKDYLASGVKPSNRKGKERIIEETARRLNAPNPPKPATVYSWCLKLKKQNFDPIAHLPGSRGRPRLSQLAICDLAKTDNATDYVIQLAWKEKNCVLTPLSPTTPSAIIKTWSLRTINWKRIQKKGPKHCPKGNISAVL